MAILAKLIGLLVAAFGLTIFVSPQFTQKVFNFFREGKRIYWAGVIRTVAGLVLLLASGQSPIPVAVMAVGVLFLLSGIIVFLCDLERLKSFLVHYSEMPALILRLLGLVGACFGILIFSIV